MIRGVLSKNRQIEESNSAVGDGKIQFIVCIKKVVVKQK